MKAATEMVLTDNLTLRRLAAAYESIKQGGGKTGRIPEL